MTLSARNRAHYSKELEWHRRKQHKPATLANYGSAFMALDAFVRGRDFKELREHDLQAFVLHLIEHNAPNTVYNYGTMLKPALARILGRRKLPYDMADALSTRHPSRQPKPERLISDAEFDAMLQASTERLAGRRAIEGLLGNAFLWCLWGTGFRIGEALALNVGSIDFDDDGAEITLPDVEGLKTGPRRIFIMEGAPALKAYLAAHPDPQPDRPFFLGFRDKTGTKRLTESVARRHVTAAADRAGVNVGRQCNLRPHDFRHTRATKFARENLQDAKLRQYFGWSPGSSMPATYVHLAHGDLRNDILRMHGIEPTGHSRPGHEVGTKACPMCAETIKAAAVKCRYCGSDIVHEGPRARSPA